MLNTVKYNNLNKYIKSVNIKPKLILCINCIT